MKGIFISYAPSKKLAFSLRYRNKDRELNNAEVYDGIRNLNEIKIQNIRFSLSYIASDTWDYRSKVEIGIKSVNLKTATSGHAIFQDIFFHPPKKKISMNFRYAVFFSPDFDLRFYEYENDLPVLSQFPSMQAMESKFYFNLSYKIRNITFSSKFARTWTTYDDQANHSISAIDDIKLQVRINL